MDVVVPVVTYPLVVQWASANRDRLRVLACCRQLHNLAMTLFSLWVAARLGRRLGLDGRFVSANDLLCRASEHDALLWDAWYYSKMWEWVDTLLLLHAGKRVSSLHYNHHMSTAPLVAIQTFHRNTCTPLADVGTLLNATVHVLMYAYYLYPRALRALKRTITALQTLQHATMLAAFAYAYCHEACDAPAVPYLASTAAYGMYFTQFVLFYARSYLA